MSSPEHGAFWIKAIPGAGKSVLAAQLASRLAQSQNGPVLYFFFRQIMLQIFEIKAGRFSRMKL
jgi:predicted ATP-dependent serine protease